MTFNLSPPDQEWTEDTYMTMWADITANALYSCSDYVIIPELSKEGRLHFHGVLRFSCPGHKEFFLDKRMRPQRVLKKYAPAGTKYSVYPKKQWIEYMWKDWLYTQVSLPGINIIQKNCQIMPCELWTLGYYESDEDEKPNEDLEIINKFQSELVDELDNVVK